MQTVNIHAAKHLSRLLDAVANGEEILIARAGRPVARLVPLEGATAPQRRQLGRLAGQFSVTLRCPRMSRTASGANALSPRHPFAAVGLGGGAKLILPLKCSTEIAE